MVQPRPSTHSAPVPAREWWVWLSSSLHPSTVHGVKRAAHIPRVHRYKGYVHEVHPKAPSAVRGVGQMSSRVHVRRKVSRMT